MQVSTLRLRDYRNYRDAQVTLGRRVTVVLGPNGAGKTNLLEGLYFGCTARSCRTVSEREMVRWGAPQTRVVVTSVAEGGPHELSVGFVPGEPKRLRVDGRVVDRLLDAPERPMVSVFLPDRLELIKGPPGLRRAHVDQVISALWPARSGTRRAYGQALAHRNALIARIRSGRASRASLSSWDGQLAHHGVTLMRDRARAVGTIAEDFARLGGALGLQGDVSITYRPRSRASSPSELRAELAERLEDDLTRGFTVHGPHRDEFATSLDAHDLRTYGSQGQQRLALLALLLAEREAIAAQRDAPPVMLLDDVMSELDHQRRQALMDLLRAGGGQSVITTTDLEHVPGGGDQEIARVVVSEGQVLEEAMV